MYCKVFLFILAIINPCYNYKILLVFPFNFRSHGILGEGILNILLEAGHEVTYITPYPVEDTHLNLRQVIIKRYDFTGITVKKFIENHKDPRDLGYIFQEMLNISYRTISDPSVQALMEDTTQTFDLVMVEWMVNDLYSGFSAVFNCPYIWFFTYENTHQILRLVHEPPNPVLVTNIRTDNVPPYNLLQRAWELFYFVYSAVFRYFYYNPTEAATYEKLFVPILSKRGRMLPPYDEIRYNASLVFTNTHITLRDRLVTPQNYKAIGGFHVSKTFQPLSKELSDIIESSNHGVILFSTGSHLKSEDMPSGLKRDLLTMFSKFNQTVLWKIDEHFEDMPSNVKTFPWIPHQSVLAHPKCVLFITHGGFLSLTESVHYGVPVIGAPIFADQGVNMKIVVKKGIGRMVHLGPEWADSAGNVLKEAVEDVLNNPSYKENVMKLSSIYHDRLTSPASEVLHWVEHVIVTQGAPHLRSPAVLVTWYQRYMDVAFVVIALIIVVFVVTKLLLLMISKVKNVLFNTQNNTEVMLKKLH
ncbi:UDP-glycosyltransferase UGT5-like [Epargyreus clarus]|uniref:UDP-glycosyltransferase UGT5-like n=1 Tax=Epargyreus clarus TaxID=520877 RepID=UPI003C2E9346